jgi:hypothetical protein
MIKRSVVCIRREQWPSQEDGLHVVRERCTTICTGDDADERDAHLHGTEETLRVGEQFQDGLRALLLPGPPRPGCGSPFTETSAISLSEKNPLSKREQDDDEDLHG